MVEPRNNLHDLQRNDPKLKALIDFIEYDILPQGNDRLCRKLVFERDLFYLNDDMLLCRGKMSYRRKPKGTDVLFENDEVLVLPDSVVDEVLHSYHDLSHSGICRLVKLSLEGSTSKIFTREFATSSENVPLVKKRRPIFLLVPTWAKHLWPQGPAKFTQWIS